MAQSPRDSGWIYQCDDIVVEPRAHRLERAGVALAVEPKAYTVLVVLLQQAGEVVSRDELLDAAWGHRHVTPGVLTRVISQLRHALGDRAGHPRYIATIHSLGYRFIGDVRRVAAPATDIDHDERLPTLPQPARPSRHLGMPWLAAVIAVAALTALLAVASLWHAPGAGTGTPSTSSPQPALVLLPFAHASHATAPRPRHWPRSHRIATTYRPPMLREGGAGYLSMHEGQAPVARD